MDVDLGGSCTSVALEVIGAETCFSLTGEACSGCSAVDGSAVRTVLSMSSVISERLQIYLFWASLMLASSLRCVRADMALLDDTLVRRSVAMLLTEGATFFFGILSTT